MSVVTDKLGRPMRELRVSVTDRCNLRCPYCMPAEIFGSGYRFLPRAEILTFEEIVRVVNVSTRLGVRKVRLTGGEPLLRRDLPVLVRMLSGCAGVEDLALTTNGLALSALATELRSAGLGRVTVSLDAVDENLFRQMSGSRRSVGDVLAGIAAAQAAGLGVKVNCVLQRGANEGEILPLALFCRGAGIALRFIEYMDAGNHNGWDQALVVPSQEVRETLAAEFSLEPMLRSGPGDVARLYRYADGRGEVGFISSVTEPFCAGCNRARLTADGHLVTCLFAEQGADLRPVLRGAADDADVEKRLREIWQGRTDRYSELRAAPRGGARTKVEMSYVGG